MRLDYFPPTIEGAERRRPVKKEEEEMFRFENENHDKSNIFSIFKSAKENF